ncbi:MAG TPA: helicase, partial [Verrucomicrobiales bacterium]|nr:helicase [Verrucomicrobiales bacterium]
KWYKQGKILEIAEYCCYDVKITKMVHEFGAKNGCVFYNNRFGKVLNVDVDWSTA